VAAARKKRPSCGWVTIFVIGQKELRPDKHFAAFSTGAQIMLYQADVQDGTKVAKAYTITKVIFDVYSDFQYVHLGVLDGE